MARKALILISGLLLACGCGLKTRPVPPSPHLPREPTPIQFEMVREGVRFQWNQAPSYDTGLKDPEGRAVRKYYAGFWVLRAKVKLTRDDCPRCPVHYTRRTFVRQPLTPRGRPTAPVVTWVDRDLEPGFRYAYVVRSTLDRNKSWIDRFRLSAPDVQIYYGQYPAPPRGVKVVPVGPGHLLVTWSPPPGLQNGSRWPGIMGYYVYRRAAGGNAVRLNQRPITDRRYLDRRVALGRRYAYSVKAVRLWRGELLTGAPSTPGGLISRRKMALTAPRDLAAHSLAHGIELRWRRNPEPDVTGYFIYRRQGRFQVPTGQVTTEPPIAWQPWRRLNQTPQPEAFYVDTRVKPGVPYEYRLRAADRSRPPRLSPYCPAVKIVFEP
jgi:hypothetical protein